MLSSQTSLSLCLLFSGNFRFKRFSFVPLYFYCFLNYRRSMGLILSRFAFRLYATNPRLKFRGVFWLLNRCWLFQFIQRRNNSLLFLLGCLNLQIPAVRENDLYVRRVCLVAYRCVCADNVRGNSYIPHVDKQTFFLFTLHICFIYLLENLRSTIRVAMVG